MPQADRPFDDDPDDRSTASRPPQFDLRTAALAMAIVSIAAATFAGLRDQGPAWPIYVLLACAAPLVLLTLIGSVQFALRLIKRNGQYGKQASGAEEQSSV
jgi:hypothetical protein